MNTSIKPSPAAPPKDAAVAGSVNPSPGNSPATESGKTNWLDKAELVPRPVDTAKLGSVISQQVPEQAKVVLIGEDHRSADTRKVIGDNLSGLKEKGFTHLVLETKVDNQALLDALQKREITDEQFREQLPKAHGSFNPQSDRAFTDLAIRARDLGMQLVAVDPRKGCSADHKESLYSSSAAMAKSIEEITKAGGRVVMPVGSAHLSMEGTKTIRPYDAPAVDIPLKDRGIDSCLERSGIATYSIVAVQKVAEGRSTPPTLVQDVLAKDIPETSLIKGAKQNINGTVDAVLVLPPRI